MNLDLIIDVYNKTFGSEIIGMSVEDIPNKISSILSKALNKKVNVQGNGLTEEIKVII